MNMKPTMKIAVILLIIITVIIIGYTFIIKKKETPEGFADPIICSNPTSDPNIPPNEARCNSILPVDHITNLDSLKFRIKVFDKYNIPKYISTQTDLEVIKYEPGRQINLKKLILVNSKNTATLFKLVPDPDRKLIYPSQKNDEGCNKFILKFDIDSTNSNSYLYPTTSSLTLLPPNNQTEIYSSIYNQPIVNPNIILNDFTKNIANLNTGSNNVYLKLILTDSDSLFNNFSAYIYPNNITCGGYMFIDQFNNVKLTYNLKDVNKMSLFVLELEPSSIPTIPTTTTIPEITTPLITESNLTNTTIRDTYKDNIKKEIDKVNDKLHDSRFLLIDNQYKLDDLSNRVNNLLKTLKLSYAKNKQFNKQNNLITFY